LDCKARVGTPIALSAFQQPEMSDNPYPDCADQRPGATSRRNARRSAQKAEASPAFGLVPAVIVTGVVLLIGVAARPSLYVAHAGFTIDWTSVLSVPVDEQALKARNEWRNTIVAEVISWPHSDEEVCDILDRVDHLTHDQTDRVVAISKLRRRLHVDLASQTADCDQFVIRMRDNDPGLAQAEVDGALQSIVSRLKTASQTSGVAASLRSGAELNKPDMPAGLSSAMNLGSASLNNSIQVAEAAQVVSRGAGYGLGLLFAAVCLGSAAGLAGQLMHQLGLVGNALKTATGGVSRGRTAKTPLAGTSPEPSRKHGPGPPSVPPPLFPSTAHR
jgi:hypothetical protein